MNFARVAAFGIGVGALAPSGCGAPPAQPTNEVLCSPSSALVQSHKGLSVAQCFSLFEAYRGQLTCTDSLPIAPSDAYADYFDCLWKDSSKPEEGMSLLESAILPHVATANDVRQRVFQRHPSLQVAFRMGLAKTDKTPNPEPGLLDLPLAESVVFGAYTYFRRSEGEGVRWGKEGVLEYWKAKGQRWIKTADCPTGVIGKCNALNVAGNDAPDNKTFILGLDEGTVQVQYTTYQVPDQISLSCDGKSIWSSGCVSTGGWVDREMPPRVSGPIKFDCPSGYLNVHVTPNCSGINQTAWKYMLTCPK